MRGMHTSGRSLLVSTDAIGMGGIRRRGVVAMGFVCGSTFNLVGLGFLSMCSILWAPEIPSGFGWIIGVMWGCYVMFSPSFIKLLFISKQRYQNICLGIMKIWFGQLICRGLSKIGSWESILISSPFFTSRR